MKKLVIKNRTSINKNESLKGETIEMKIERIVENKEPITDGAPIIYTERKQGILPEYNIRTDRFDLAIGAMDYVSRSQIAKRDSGGTIGAKNEGNAETADNTSDLPN